MQTGVTGRSRVLVYNSFFRKLISALRHADTNAALNRGSREWTPIVAGQRTLPSFVPPRQIGCMIGYSSQTVTFDQFCQHVEKQLCRLGQLENGQFPMTRREVSRGGKVCGFYFCIHGPRSVKLTAVYDQRQKTTIYYGTDGVRRSQEIMSVAMPLPSPPLRSA